MPVTQTQAVSSRATGKTQSRKVQSTMNPSETPASTVQTVEKTYKYFNLDTFQEVSEKAQVSFTPANDYTEAVSRVGNDAATITKAINAYLQRAAFNEKRKEIASKGASKKIVLSVIKPFRSLPPFSEMGKFEMVDGKQVFVVDRKAQTAALLAEVKGNAFMVNSIKAASLKAAEADDDDDESESDD